MKSIQRLTGILAAAALTLVLVLAAGVAVAANPGNPATLDTQATVEILKPISITENIAMSFGRIVGPIGADATNTYTTQGTVTGTGGGSHVSGATRGSFAFSGSAEPVFISGASTGACSDPRVVLVRPDFTDSPISTATFGFGPFGEITITNASDGAGPLGVVTCPFALTIRYQ